MKNTKVNPHLPNKSKSLDEFLKRQEDLASRCRYDLDDFSDESTWEKVKWEVDWHWNDWMSSVRGFCRGIKNFWTFREEIMNFRWYDSGFLHQTLRSRLNFMADNWKDAHYIGSEVDEKELRELVAMLDLIVVLEDECTIEAEKQIDEIYDEFGKRLFAIKDFMNSEGHVSTFSAFRKFWD